MTEPDTTETVAEPTLAEQRRAARVASAREWIDRIRKQIHDLNDDNGAE